jgi:hypothetical protein
MSRRGLKLTQADQVEVLLPVKAPSPWLEQTLVGLQAQSLDAFMLRVMMHGRDDQASKLIAHYFPNSHVQIVDSSVTFSNLLNIGLHAGNSTYVARIDADDVPMPTRLEKQLSVLNSLPQIDLVATSVSLIDENGHELGERRLPELPEKLLRRLRWKNNVPHPSVMYRRSKILEIGGYRESAKYAEDYDLWLRLLGQKNLFVIPEMLTQYRLHPSQISRTKLLDAECIASIAEARNSFAKRRGELQLAATARQAIWRLPQHVRAMAGKRH